MIDFDNTKIAFNRKSKRELNRSYWIFKLISNSLLVKFGTMCLRFAITLRLPVLGIFRNTIYKEFCGGTSIIDSQKSIDKLAKYKIGAILDYSVEGQETEMKFDAVMKETIETIERAFENDKIPFCVFKVSGIGRFSLITKINNKNSLNEKEEEEYARLKNRINLICQKAYDLNVRILIDAEESWIQNEIDNLTTNMMRKYNKDHAIIYNTLQMYRWDRLDYLNDLYQDSQNKKYTLGLKIVRGAYMEKERKRAKKMGYRSPIQTNKQNTDNDYNLALKFCVDRIEHISICAGTHNEQSSIQLAQLLSDKNIKKNDTRIYSSQLLGMSDHITYNLSYNGYNVAKYVPYGPIKEVIPYLIRRANENTSISGQTGRELSLIIKEKARRSKK